MSRKIQAFLVDVYPHAEHVFTHAAAIPKLKPRQVPLAEAVVRVVVGQMLSGQVADAIYERLQTVAAKRGYAGTWDLRVPEMRRWCPSDNPRLALPIC